MSKRNNMRRNESDTQRLKREVKNFNQRVRYQQKKNPEANYLPGLKTYEEVNRFVESRADFNWIIKQLQSFNAKTAKEVDARGKEIRELKSGERRAGYKNETRTVKPGERTFTKWETSFINSAAKKAYKEQEEKWNKIKDQPVKIAGVEQDVTHARMTDPAELEMKPRKYDVSKYSGEKQEKAIKNIFDSIDRELEKKKLGQMVENYIKGLKDNNFLNDAPEIEWFIRQLPPELVYDTMKLDMDATFLYYKSPEAFEARLDNIYHSWQHAYEEHVGHEWDGEVTEL